MKTISQTYHIKAPIEEVWKGLTEPDYINEWGGGPAEMDDEKGTEFEFWGGDIHGTNTEVIKNEKLVQDWYGDKWDKPSKATFTLKKVSENLTDLQLVHSSIPEKDVKRFDDGWKDYFLGPMKEFLENK